MTWGTYVAIGDSFTEGVGDERADGSPRGWADLVAADLDVHYANLAVRGRRLKDIVGQQVDAAVALRPDLVSMTAGGNDALRPGFEIGTVMAGFEQGVARPAGAGADVLLFRFPDLSVRLPLPGVLRPRIIAMNGAISSIAAQHGAFVVDLWADPAFASPRLWADDRIHPSPDGHRRIARHVLAVLGRRESPEPPEPEEAYRTSDLRWAAGHLRPWLVRRMRGRSSGDGRSAKRPLAEVFRREQEGRVR